MWPLKTVTGVKDMTGAKGMREAKGMRGVAGTKIGARNKENRAGTKPL